MALSRVAPEMEDQWINQPMAKSPGLSRWLSEDKKNSPPTGMIGLLILMRVTHYTLRNLV